MKDECRTTFSAFFLAFSALEEITTPIINGQLQDARFNIHDSSQNFEMGINALLDGEERTSMLKEFNDLCEEIRQWFATPTKGKDYAHLSFNAQSLDNHFRSVIPIRILKKCGCPPS